MYFQSNVHTPLDTRWNIFILKTGRIFVWIKNISGHLHTTLPGIVVRVHDTLARYMYTHRFVIQLKEIVNLIQNV